MEENKTRKKRKRVPWETQHVRVPLPLVKKTKRKMEEYKSKVLGGKRLATGLTNTVPYTTKSMVIPKELVSEIKNDIAIFKEDIAATKR